MAGKRREIPWLEVRNGVYYVYWYEQHGTDKAGRPKFRTKRISLGTSDSVEAQKRYAGFLAGGKAGFGIEGALGLTVVQCLDDYWREHVATAVVDVRRAEYAIRHLKTYFNNTLLRDVDIPTTRAYADARRMGLIGGGKRQNHNDGADSTIRRELKVLNAAANHAARWKRIGPKANPPSPMPSVELPAEPRSEGVSDDDYLTREEFKLTVSRATGSLRDFIVLAYDSGSRRGAIEALTKFQVNLKQGRVNLRSPAESENKRRSKKRRPVVPIGPDARPVYERRMAESSTEYLFGTVSSIYGRFRRHMEAIGLGHKRNPHILRHTRATHLLQDGVPIYDVAKLLGDTVATVERVYGHHSPEYLADTINRGTGS